MAARRSRILRSTSSRSSISLILFRIEIEWKTVTTVFMRAVWCIVLYSGPFKSLLFEEGKSLELVSTSTSVAGDTRSRFREHGLERKIVKSEGPGTSECR